MRRSWFAVALALVLLVSACSGETRKVENLVTVYNNVLIDSYLGTNPRLMENFTTELELVRIDNYITYLVKNNRILKMDIVGLDFVNVKVSGEKAEAITRERWVYTYIDARNRKPVSKEYDIVLSNVYHLKKDEGRWVVDSLDSDEVVSESKVSESAEMEDAHRGLADDRKQGVNPGK